MEVCFSPTVSLLGAKYETTASAVVTSECLLASTSYPADANMTMEDLKQMANSMSANQMVNRLQRYVSKVQGTNQHWYQWLQEFLALIEQKGCPTFFFTFSAADMHWPDLQRLLQNDEGAARSERAQAVIDNPHLTEWFFMQRMQEFGLMASWMPSGTEVRIEKSSSETSESSLETVDQKTATTDAQTNSKKKR